MVVTDRNGIEQFGDQFFEPANALHLSETNHALKMYQSTTTNKKVTPFWVRHTDFEKSIGGRRKIGG